MVVQERCQCAGLVPDSAHLLGTGRLLRLEENLERRLPAGKRLGDGPHADLREVVVPVHEKVKARGLIKAFAFFWMCRWLGGPCDNFNDERNNGIQLRLLEPGRARQLYIIRNVHCSEQKMQMQRAESTHKIVILPFPRQQ